jgi:peptidylprolyl isomerase domain and WD repeat-containing protein 1
MHREQVTHLVVTRTEFVITASIDGVVKFWKKQPQGMVKKILIERREIIKNPTHVGNMPFYFTRFSFGFAIGIEFVKHFRAHNSEITAMAVSSNGQTLVTVSTDKSMKLYDVLNFDMTTMLKLTFVPSAVEFISADQPGSMLIAW